METKPLVSVVVVCRNPGHKLHDALHSVWAQQHISMEVVVIDGASTDGTPSWLADQMHRLSAFVSEADIGVYDAMNKGVKKCTGEWVLFLGADDALAAPDSLSRLVRAAQPEDRLVIGHVLYTDGRYWKAGTKFNPAFRNFLHHQGLLYRRDILSGKAFDEALRYQGDYELNLRLWHRKIRPRAADCVVTICGTGGLSDRADWDNYREEIVVRHRFYRGGFVLAYDLATIGRFLRKKLTTIVRKAGSTHR